MAPEQTDNGGVGTENGDETVVAQENREHEAFISNFNASGTSSHLYPLTSSEVLFGIAAVLGWVLFFASGTVISTANAREVISAANFDSFFHVFSSWLTVVTCYTVTNVAFLSCLAAIAGQFSSRSRESELRVSNGRAVQNPHFKEVLACYASASMRGFVIYLLIVSGLLLVTTEAMATPNQNQYVRLAGTMSVVSFIAGYDSNVFRQALERVVALVSQSDVKRRR